MLLCIFKKSGKADMAFCNVRPDAGWTLVTRALDTDSGSVANT